MASQSFNRPNLRFSVQEKAKAKPDALQQLLRTLGTPKFQGSGVVYCTTRVDAEDTANYLLAHGVQVGVTHCPPNTH